MKRCGDELAAARGARAARLVLAKDVRREEVGAMAHRQPHEAEARREVGDLAAVVRLEL